MRKNGNLLIIHGGAPTAVMNASLYGAVQEAKKHLSIDRILGANGGTEGVLNEDFIDLAKLGQVQLSLLLQTPGSVIGTSRTPLRDPEYQNIANIIKKHNIRYLLINGGNGTMDACGHIAKFCGTDNVNIVGIPKTIDNDIAVTDHAPGFGSAARYLAATVSEVCQDVRSMPIHACVIEAMGRNAGWLAAASALAADYGVGPDLIYLPERAFNQNQFLDDVKRLHDKKGGIVIVASEGLRDANGQFIAPPIFTVGRSVYYGDVGSHLANLIIQHLGIKARSEKPGICGRASFAHQSTVDRDEAVACGSEALRLAVEGYSGVMVTLDRASTSPYHCSLGKASIQDVMLTERIMPDSFINSAGNHVTDSYLNWCRPLLGDPLPTFLYLPEREREASDK